MPASTSAATIAMPSGLISTPLGADRLRRHLRRARDRRRPTRRTLAPAGSTGSRCRRPVPPRKLARGQGSATWSRTLYRSRSAKSEAKVVEARAPLPGSVNVCPPTLATFWQGSGWLGRRRRAEQCRRGHDAERHARGSLAVSGSAGRQRHAAGLAGRRGRGFRRCSRRRRRSRRSCAAPRARWRRPAGGWSERRPQRGAGVARLVSTGSRPCGRPRRRPRPRWSGCRPERPGRSARARTSPTVAPGW